MAANLAGMFNQINQAIQANPLAQPVDNTVPGMAPRPQDTRNPLLQKGAAGLMGALGDTTDYRTSKQAYDAMTKQLSQLDLTNSQGLLKAAKLYGELGMADKQVALAQAGAAKAQEELALRRQQARREALITRANNLGMSGLADEISSGAADVDEASRTLNKLEISTFDIPARLSLAKQMGLTEEEFRRNGLAKASPDAFQDFVDGRKGTPKAYSNAAGENLVLVTNDATGKVYDPETKTYKMPSEIGLKPQVALSRVETVDKGFAAKITDGAADGYLDLWDKAKSTVESIDLNTQSFRMLNEGLTTGAFGDERLSLGRLAVLMGMDNKFVEDTNRTSAYLAQRGRQVGEVIKMFGSGTGLSDKDAERAEMIAAGSVKQTPATIRELLELERKYLLKGYNDYQTSYENLVRNNKNDLVPQSALDILKLEGPLYGMDEEVTLGIEENNTAPELSESAKRYVQ